jgi:hypothetical protein
MLDLYLDEKGVYFDHAWHAGTCMNVGLHSVNTQITFYIIVMPLCNGFSIVSYSEMFAKQKIQIKAKYPQGWIEV